MNAGDGVDPIVTKLGLRTPTTWQHMLFMCLKEARRRDMRPYKVLYERFDNDPTVPRGGEGVAAGAIFVSPEGTFYANVWGHDMAGPYDTWQAAAAYSKLILDSDGGER